LDALGFKDKTRPSVVSHQISVPSAMAQELILPPAPTLYSCLNGAKNGFVIVAHLD
jgi:hypothetical protein